MARKDFENNSDESETVQPKGRNKHGSGGKPFVPSHHSHNFIGGGTKKDFRHSSNTKNSDDHTDIAVGKQLSTLGLTIREMPGDGNCLFRALSDQTTGSSRNHLEYRRAVVQYMRDCRADFEPFVEDDEPFDRHLHRLGQAGTFAGNDAIVAFARLNNVSVVIHQLNSPAWVIHPSKDPQKQVCVGGREVHIFYHNGDHYNSVRKVGDDSESPTNICLQTQTNASKTSFSKASGKKSPPHSACGIGASSSDSNCFSANYESKRDEDYWVKDTSDVERLVEEVMQQTGYTDPQLVRETLLDYNFDLTATIDFIISMSYALNENHTENSPNILDNSSENKLDTEPSPTMQTQTSFLNLVHVSCPPDEKVPQQLDVKDNPEISSEDSQVVADSDDGSNCSEEAPTSVSSQDKEKGKLPPRTEAKLSRRQKKDIKRRKREADRRRAPASADKENATNTVVISHFGSLDI